MASSNHPLRLLNFNVRLAQLDINVLFQNNLKLDKTHVDPCLYHNLHTHRYHEHASEQIVDAQVSVLPPRT